MSGIRYAAENSHASRSVSRGPPPSTCAPSAMPNTAVISRNSRSGRNAAESRGTTYRPRLLARDHRNLDAKLTPLNKNSVSITDSLNVSEDEPMRMTAKPANARTAQSAGARGARRRGALTSPGSSARDRSTYVRPLSVAAGWVGVVGVRALSALRTYHWNISVLGRCGQECPGVPL